MQPEMCTNRPSPSPKGEVSRNIVGVTEVAPKSWFKASHGKDKFILRFNKRN